MHVVRHQHAGVDAAARVARVVAQPVEIVDTVVVTVEAGLPVVAALDQVKRNAGQGDAGTSWHEYLRSVAVIHFADMEAGVVPLPDSVVQVRGRSALRAPTPFWRMASVAGLLRID